MFDLCNSLEYESINVLFQTGHGPTHSPAPAHGGDYKSYKYQWTMSPLMSAVIAVVSIVSGKII